MLIRKAYDPQMRVSFETTGESRTKQSEAQACDINHILRRYAKTGIVEHLNRYGGDYGDFTGVQDYQDSLNQVLAAREAFGSLPAKLRRRFENDPASFLAFVSDPANREEMMELGLLKPASTPAPAPAADDDGAEEIGYKMPPWLEPFMPHFERGLEKLLGGGPAGAAVKTLILTSDELAGIFNDPEKWAQAVAAMEVKFGSEKTKAAMNVLLNKRQEKKRK